MAVSFQLNNFDFPPLSFSTVSSFSTVCSSNDYLSKPICPCKPVYLSNVRPNVRGSMMAYGRETSVKIILDIYYAISTISKVQHSKPSKEKIFNYLQSLIRMLITIIL